MLVSIIGAVQDVVDRADALEKERDELKIAVEEYKKLATSMTKGKVQNILDQLNLKEVRNFGRKPTIK